MPAVAPRAEPAADDPNHFDKIASVAIQGGGVYGLTLLGQLQGVIAQGYRIVALSGTSAGAIVSTLYWAGVPLERIRTTFEVLAGPPNRIPDLLGNDEYRCRAYGAYDRNSPVKNRVERRPMRAEWVRRVLGVFRRIGRATRCGWPALAVALSTGGAELAWFRKTAWDDGGFFPGDEFERLIDTLIRESPRVAPHLASGQLTPTGPYFTRDSRSDDRRTDRLITFGDLWRLMSDRLASFPALTLTAANLTTGRLELIDSTDPLYERVPVATAVRASGGFPGFFTPVPVFLPDREHRGAHFTHQVGRWCQLVDGGVICNFPGFVFSRAMRVDQLGRHDEYRADVMRPWVNIGLRLSEPKTPQEVGGLWPVVRRVFGLLSGGGRTILEDRLASSTVERYTPSEQPFDQTGWPPEDGLLGFDKLTPFRVNEMWNAGHKFSRRRLDRLAFELPPAADVEGWMNGLVYAVAAAFGDPENERYKIRATLFVPKGERLHLHYRVNMGTPTHPDPDWNLELNPRRREGLAGYCFVRRAPLVCNLDGLNRADARHVPFRLTDGNQLKIRPERNWLMSMPVFDPRTASPVRFPNDIAPDPQHPSVEGVFAELTAPLDGALFGVLSVDAEFEYGPDRPRLNPDVREQVEEDSRVKLVYDTLASTAWDIGKEFDRCFACSRPEA